MEAAEEGGAAPEQQYSEAGNAHYAGTQYDFPVDANEYTNIEQALDTSANAGTSKGNHGSSLGGYMTMPVQNGHTDVLRADSNTSTSLHTAIAPPTTPLNPATKRKSPEDASQTTPAGGDPSRKRSKVSRACDQCRKKKVRCDADSEGTGQLKTCSNCVKSGQTCDYSRVPQKRGPSKGYIKELSERVQQVEGQLALQHPAGYRGSFDGQPGAYGDPAYSPDEDPNLRRQSAFSQPRGSFSGFDRDRFPSIGGWNQVTSNPRHPSIAIPPDQTSPTQGKPPSSNVLRPFWTNWVDPPSKQKQTSVDASEVPEADRILFSHYYETVHPQCPILPDPDTPRAIDVLALATNSYQHAFLSALSLLPQKRQEQSGPSTKSTAQAKEPEARKLLENFINEKARESITTRSNVDSLVLLWTELILLVVVQHDINSWNKSNLPQCDLIRMSIDLCEDFFKIKNFTSDNQHDVDWIRALHIAAMFGRLYALSKGEANDPVPASIAQFLTINARIASPRVSFVVLMTDTLQASLALLPQEGSTVLPGTLLQFARLQSANIRAWLSASGLSPDDPIVTEIKAFGDLLSLRCNNRVAKPGVVGPAVNLAEAVRVSSLSELDVTNGRYIFNPLSLHTSTLATITLLELLQCDFYDQLSEPLVQEGLEEMKKCLLGLVERKNELDGGPGRFWANTLVDMIEERQKLQPARQDKKEEDIAVDFVLLLQRGYANVVSDYASK
ncbi:hypothetical protein PMZ80_000998 [Knufia obscura]|nr:hypothetical protein PMZ80_000998 [Knufia obscura]